MDLENPSTILEKENEVCLIQNLPAEVMAMVFFNLDKKIRQRVRAICKRWKLSFDVMYQIHINLTNENWKFLMHTTNRSLDVTLSSFTRSLDLNDYLTNSFIFRLRVLEFNNWVVPYNISTILKESINLECLSLTNCVCYEVNSNAFLDEFNKDDVILQKLQQFKYAYPVELRDEYLLSIMRQILSKSNLKHVEISTNRLSFHIIKFFQTCLFSDMDLSTQPVERYSPPVEVLQTYVDLIKDHIVTLETITLSRNFDGYYEDPIIFTLTDDNSTFPPQMIACDFLNGQGRNETDQTYGRFGQGLCSANKQKSVCLNFLAHENQMNLEKLFVECGWFVKSTTIFRVIEARCGTLTEITCCYSGDLGWNTRSDRDYNHAIWDGTIFSQCNLLRKLSLFKHQINEIESPQDHLFINVHLLPPLLQTFETSAILCYPEKLFHSILFSNMKKLERLYLYSKPFIQLDGNKIFQMDMNNLKHILNCLTSLKILKLKPHTLVMKIKPEKCASCGACHFRKNSILSSIPNYTLTQISHNVSFHLNSGRTLTTIYILSSFRCL